MERAVFDRIRELEQTHWWFTARRSILRRFLKRLSLPGEADILEVGCGTGGNIPTLKEFGRVSALEPDDASRVYVQTRTGVVAVKGFLPDDLPWPAESFDLVCAFDVIEHVEQDGQALSALAQILKPGGVLLTTVPAYPWMYGPHDAAHHHKRRYNKAAYVALMVGAGLEVDRATFFNTLLFPVALLQRMAKKLTRSDRGDDAMPPLWLNRLFGSIFEAEGPLLDKIDLPVGLSLLVSARRRAEA